MEEHEEIAQAEDIAYIELKGVGFSIGGNAVLKDIDLSFMEGRASFIMGSSGAGKSTLAKIAAGILVPDQGEVLNDGIPISRMREKRYMEFLNSYGFVFQDAALWANQTILNNLCIAQESTCGGLSRKEMEKRAKDMALRVGFTEELSQRPADLSLGEQKLISAARAMVCDPPAIFMDEPQDSLDDESRHRMLGIVLELKMRGKTLIVVTHDTAMAAAAADDLFVMDKGMVIARGPYRELARSQDRKIRAIMGMARRERAGEGEGQ